MNCMKPKNKNDLYNINIIDYRDIPNFRNKDFLMDDIIVEYYKNDYLNIPSKLTEIDFQINEDCNLCCTYCYQKNKTKKRMSFDVAKKTIDFLLHSTPKNNSYINYQKNDFISLVFIGGEPTLNFDLIDKILTYFIEQCIELNHPWLYKWVGRIDTNGVLLNTERFKAFEKKWGVNVSCAITLDGNKELHDSCRIFKNGQGSYDYVIKAINNELIQGKEPNSKLTISPENIKYLYDAVINFIDLGYKRIRMNCVYEEGWTLEHAKIYYKELKKIANYLIDNDLYNKIYIKIFDEDFYCPQLIDDNKNFCGGNGEMFSVNPDGDFFNCIRYTSTSLGNKVKPLIIGNIYKGIGTTEEFKDNINKMQCVTRLSQSSEECINCPVSAGCGWCSAYNYQYFGTVNKRTTFICWTHKAEALANVYYWNKVYRIKNLNKRFLNHLSKEDSLKIINLDEYALLETLCKKE